MRSLVTSISLYACESWTLSAELRRRIQAMEMRCYRKILRISHKDHVTNKEVCAKIQQAIGPHEDLLTIVKRRKLKWYGHVSQSSGLAKTILQRTVKGGTRQGNVEFLAMLTFWFKLVKINCKHKFSNIMYKFIYDMYQAGICKSPFLSSV